MKIIDITPGTLVAVRANKLPGYCRSYGWGRDGTDEQVRDGVKAAPVRVIAVGKFRWQRQGACDRAIVEDGHTTTVKVSYPSFADTEAWKEEKDAPGREGGLPISSKKIVWEEGILNVRDLILPWADYLKRVEERKFALDEVAAYRKRYQGVLQELRTLAIEEHFKHLAASDFEPSIEREFPLRSEQREPYFKVYLRGAFDVEAIKASAATKKRIKDLVAEAHDLDDRIRSCAVK